ncbi:MAG: peptidoglycan-binding protein [Xanthobacteraceae bacterium]
MPGSLSPWPVTAAGSNGHPVWTLQDLLRARGHAVAVDGIFGPQTDAAVKAFQTSKGLTANGTVDPTTWKALIVQVKKGASGDAVRGVQEEFQFRNGSGDATKGVQIDGAFGPQTDAAVRGFQHALSLDIPSVAVDGIVGPITWQALAFADLPRRACRAGPRRCWCNAKTGVEPLSTDGVYHFAGVMWWGTSMGKRYSALRRLWFAAAEFAVMSAAVLTVATIAKYGL